MRIEDAELTIYWDDGGMQTIPFSEAQLFTTFKALGITFPSETTIAFRPDKILENEIIPLLDRYRRQKIAENQEEN